MKFYSDITVLVHQQTVFSSALLDVVYAFKKIILSLMMIIIIIGLLIVIIIDHCSG